MYERFGRNDAHAEALTQGTAEVPFEHSVPGAHALHLCEVVKHWGISPADLLGPFGLTEQQLEVPSLRLPSEQARALIERARGLTGEPGLGFYLGLHKRATFYGHLGFAVMHASTLREALELAVEFAPAVGTALSLRLHVEDGLASLTIEEHADLGSARDVVLISLLVGIMQIGTALTGRNLSGSADLAIPEPSYWSRFAHLTPNTRCGQPATRVVFDAAYLDLPLVAPDRAAMRLAREQCERSLLELGQRGTVAERTRRLVMKAEGACCLDDVAETLHLSRRTLKRRLAEEGVTFSGIRNDARRERALLLLQSPDLTLETIAERLGYSTVPNFVRAFRRLTGDTPGAYRRAQLRRSTVPPKFQSGIPAAIPAARAS